MDSGLIQKSIEKQNKLSIITQGQDFTVDGEKVIIIKNNDRENSYPKKTYFNFFNFFLFFFGLYKYVTLPKESDPDISLPVIYTTISHKGISPKDSERLLIKPIEKELKK